jgi:hypothetical protein
MDGLGNAGSVGCGKGDHVSNGCWNSGGKADDAFAMRSEGMRVGLFASGSDSARYREVGGRQRRKGEASGRRN